MHLLDATHFIHVPSLFTFHPTLQDCKYHPHFIEESEALESDSKALLSSATSFIKHPAVVSRAVDNGQAASYTSL